MKAAWIARTAVDAGRDESNADEPMPPMEIVRAPVPLAHIRDLGERTFGDLVKAVVDIAREIMAVGGELHADEEAMLLSDGSRQGDLWGVNLYPERHRTPDFIEFDSMINLRPRQGNRSRSVDDPSIRASIAEIVDRLVPG
jgi:hypothetical protein